VASQAVLNMDPSTSLPITLFFGMRMLRKRRCGRVLHFGSMLQLITRTAGTLPADISCIEAPADLAWTESANLSHPDV